MNPDIPEESRKIAAHASEASFGSDDEYDVVYINNGTIENLQNEALRYL
jgi:hypothetical protein